MAFSSHSISHVIMRLSPVPPRVLNGVHTSIRCTCSRLYSRCMRWSFP
ncbi:hypothetical protein Ahy_A07g034435 isoform B [Arachis hypogaea]|uniref:Uncharacterized protein n=1 Tax=Arachis hypogaea TaxID=3818 RepID=A0A445CBS7_ARAHY|nr:hypothetical protein Ahy_A07g034435 isoform B [Arachis hypogaea]